jgi:hypothetical protein
MLAGCGGHTLYEWRGYENKLYDHYKNPAQQQEFTEAMKEVVLGAEAEGRVPPGIYAEYGFLLFEQGNSAAAIQYYKKEAARWPESEMLMEKMIAVAEKRFKKPVAPGQPAVSVPPAKPAAAAPQEVSR